MSNLELLEKFPESFKGKIITLLYSSFADYVDMNKIRVISKTTLQFCDKSITKGFSQLAYYIFTEDRVVFKLNH